MIGMALLSLSSFLALLQFILPSVKKVSGSAWGPKLIETLAAATAFMIGSAFFYLIYVFASSDLSFLNVALNSHSASELLYKISGVWGNHEGSMLLWLVLLTSISTVFGLQRRVPQNIRMRVLQVLGAISLSFHLFILLISNPFVQLHQTPKQGMGLNPLLEDPALTIHPPILYTGLALLSVLFALACVGLQRGQLDKAWAKLMRTWTLACWCFLTLGIALGSWWAYYELGWGGWWFWDPVENLSLLPWLVITALLHSLIVVQNSSSQKFTAPFLAITAFLLALLSLFLVRSGALSSVHAFAVDPLRGSFLALIAVCFTLYGLRSLFRFRTEKSFEQPYILSREAFLFLNTLLLFSIAAIVLIGTVYPLILQITTGRIISVGAPYFSTTTLPFFLMVTILMAASPFVSWQQARLSKSISYVGTFALAAFIATTYVKTGWPVIACLFLAASFSIFLATILDLARKLMARKQIALHYYAMSLAHLSIAIVIAGAVIDSFDKIESVYEIKQSGAIEFNGYHLTLDKVDQIRAPYFQREAAFITARKGEASIQLNPEKRYYPLHEMITSETDIKAVGLADIYAVLGTEDSHNGWLLKLHWHPAIRLLWIGAGLMVLAGFLGFVASLRGVKSE